MNKGIIGMGIRLMPFPVERRLITDERGFTPRTLLRRGRITSPRSRRTITSSIVVGAVFKKAVGWLGAPAAPDYPRPT